MRRDADRLVREHLVGLLAETHGKLRKATGDLAKQAKLKHMTVLDGIGKRIEKATDLIRHADTGYAGWFAAVKISEAELDRLYDYDVALKQFIGELDGVVTELTTAPDEQLPGTAAKVTAALEELDHMIDNRRQVALGLVP